MSLPSTTRLRFVFSKDPMAIVVFCDSLGVRIEIKGNVVWNGKQWYLWFIPSDDGSDIMSGSLD